MSVSKDHYKAQADRLGARLQQYDVTLKRGHVLECIAAVHGFRSWDHLCGSSTDLHLLRRYEDLDPASRLELLTALRDRFDGGDAAPSVPAALPLMVPKENAAPTPRVARPPAPLPRFAMALSEIANGPGHLAILGRSGSGKTTLLARAAASLRSSGKRVLGITAKPSTVHPTGNRCLELSSRADITRALGSGALVDANIDVEMVLQAEWETAEEDVLRLATACVEAGDVDFVAIDEVPVFRRTVDFDDRFEGFLRLCRKQGVRVIAAGQRLPQHCVDEFSRILCLPLLLSPLDNSHMAIKGRYEAQSRALNGERIPALRHLHLALSELQPIQRAPDGVKLEGVLVQQEHDGVRGGVGHVELVLPDSTP